MSRQRRNFDLLILLEESGGAGSLVSPVVLQRMTTKQLRENNRDQAKIMKLNLLLVSSRLCFC